MVADAASGAELWRGPASYVLRPPARVVALSGLGELQVTEQGCRLVWAREGLSQLRVLTGDVDCAQADTMRLCFRHARFDGSGAAGVPAVVVDGCADENDLLESRLGAQREATVGPVDWRRRCAPLPQRPRRCDVTYVALRGAEHEANAEAARGASLTWDGERFGACFLERDAGAYRLELWVEDSCGVAGPVVLRGHSSDLD